MRERLKPILCRFSRRRAVGLVVEDDRATACRIVITPLGAVERGCHAEVVSAGEPVERAVRRALDAALDGPGWSAAPVALGLPPRKFLFASRPASAMGQQASGEGLLNESMQAANVLVEELEIDVLLRKTSRGTDEALVVAARRKDLAPLIEAAAAAGAGAPLYGVEPSPFGLLRAAAARHPAPRKEQAVYRAFLGRDAGVVVRSSGPRPEGWRLFALPAGEEAASLASAVGSMRMLAGRRGEADGGPSRVIVHGRPELAGAIGACPAWEALGLGLTHHAGPSLDDAASAAAGVAAGCHLDEDEAHNLARGRRPRRSLAAVFPWVQTAAMAAVLALATGLMTSRLYDLKTRVNVVTARAGRHAWMSGLTVRDLQQQRADLTTRAELIGQYLKTRYQWGRFTREVAGRLPSSMGITSLSGKCPLAAAGGKSAPARSLSLQLEAPLPAGTTVPADINALLENLRAAPLLKANLPQITMSELKWAAGRGGRTGTVATFSLQCAPAVKAAAKDKGKAPKKAG